MKHITIFKLLPILILYFIVFFVLANNSIEWGDQGRYAGYAENLTRGFYAPADTLLLWNGPGYPLVLVPFAALHIPWFYAKMLNPVFMFLTVFLVYIILKNYTSEKASLFFAYMFALYPPFYEEMQYLITESFARLLIALFAYFMLKWFKKGRYFDMALAGVCCAFIILTKVVFGYIALTMLLLGLIFAHWNTICRRMTGVYAIALLFCLPYLFYTYSLTGKLFYWANSGGQVLYWMSDPYPQEYGDWQSEYEVSIDPHFSHHRELFQKLSGLDFMKQDEILKKQAFENIKNHPAKFLYNWVANLSRLFLNFPYSYKYQNPVQLLFLIPGSLLLSALLFCIYPLVKSHRNIPPEIIHVIILLVVFIAGHSFVYANARYLGIMMPFLLIVIVYTATNLIKTDIPAQHTA